MSLIFDIKIDVNICEPHYVNLLSFKWNSIRLGGPAHGIVTKTVHKFLLEGGECQWGRGGGDQGVGVLGSRG